MFIRGILSQLRAASQIRSRLLLKVRKELDLRELLLAAAIRGGWNYLPKKWEEAAARIGIGTYLGSFRLMGSRAYLCGKICTWDWTLFGGSDIRRIVLVQCSTHNHTRRILGSCSFRCAICRRVDLAGN